MSQESIEKDKKVVNVEKNKEGIVSIENKVSIEKIKDFSEIKSSFQVNEEFKDVSEESSYIEEIDSEIKELNKVFDLKTLDNVKKNYEDKLLLCREKLMFLKEQNSKIASTSSHLEKESFDIHTKTVSLNRNINFAMTLFDEHVLSLNESSKLPIVKLPTKIIFSALYTIAKVIKNKKLISSKFIENQFSFSDVIENIDKVNNSFADISKKSEKMLNILCNVEKNFCILYAFLKTSDIKNISQGNKEDNTADLIKLYKSEAEKLLSYISRIENSIKKNKLLENKLSSLQEDKNKLAKKKHHLKDVVDAHKNLLDDESFSKSYESQFHKSLEFSKNFEERSRQIYTLYVNHTEIVRKIGLCKDKISLYIKNITVFFSNEEEKKNINFFLNMIEKIERTISESNSVLKQYIYEELKSNAIILDADKFLEELSKEIDFGFLYDATLLLENVFSNLENCISYFELVKKEKIFFDTSFEKIPDEPCFFLIKNNNENYLSIFYKENNENIFEIDIKATKYTLHLNLVIQGCSKKSLSEKNKIIIGRSIKMIAYLNRAAEFFKNVMLTPRKENKNEVSISFTNTFLKNYGKYFSSDENSKKADDNLLNSNFLIKGINLNKKN